MKSFKDIKRKNDTAIFLGCGPSINELTEEDKEKIKSMDVWVSNNFLINEEIIPDFYHLEIKKHRNGKLIEDMIPIRKKVYQDVNWILDGSRSYLLNYISPKTFKNIFCYRKQISGNSGKYDLLPEHVTVSCIASLTCILDIMARQGYKKIYIAGVDLNTSKYFWSENPEYNDLPIPTILNSCKPDERDSNSNHPTSERNIQQFIKDFGEYHKLNFVNISPNSLLANYLPTETL